MLYSIRTQNPKSNLESSPGIPGFGWIASGTGDFSLGNILIEVKHTNKNFGSSDLRQILMYWLMKYAASIESTEKVWTDVLLLNPRRNAALLINFDFLSQPASANSNQVELYKLLRSIVGQKLNHF